MSPAIAAARVLMLLAGFAVCASSTAATATANDRLPDWISISPQLRSTVSAGSAERFPSASERKAWQDEGFGYVDLVWRVQMHVERDGTIESRTEVVRHFLSDSGIAQAGNMEVYADAWRDEVTIEEAYSISEGASPQFVDPATVEALPETTPNVFSDIHRIILPVPGLRVGSNAHIVVSRRFASSEFPLPWSWMATLGSLVPIEKLELTVTRDAGAPEIVWATNDPGVECDESADERRLVCERSGIEAVKLDPNVYSYADLVPHLFVGKRETWASLQAAVRALVEESAKLTPELRAKAADLGIDASDGPRDKLWKILRFVADEIRYVSIAHGDSTVVPHAASVTLARRYGDCKDKVTLMVALAEEVGLELVPVLVSSQRKARDGVLRPASGYFDHMIACLYPEDAEPICVDPTQAYSGFDLHPQLAGAIALPLDATIPAALGNVGTPEFGWHIDLRRDLSMEPDASVRVRDVRSFTGPGAASARTDILALSSADRDAWLRQDFRDANGGTATPRFSFRSLRDASVPYVIESNLSHPGGYRKAAGEYFGYDPWLIYYARAMLSANRHHRYLLQGLRYTAEESISMCCGRIEHATPVLAFESRFGRLERTSRVVDGKLVIRTVLEIPAAVVPVADVPRLERFIIQAFSESGYWFSWNPTE